MNADVEKAVGLVADHIADLNRCVGVLHAHPHMKATAAEFAKAAKELAQVVKALRDLEAEIARLRGVADLIPTTWLDPLLTGPDAVIHGQPYDGHDIKNLLRALRDRITAHLGGEQ